MRALLLIALAAPLGAHDPVTTKLTWSREISRIFEARCTGCHRPEGMAPMPLQTFAEVRPWAVAIKESVLTREMPPWPAAKGFGHFANDRALTQEEILRIAEWVEGGAPEGEGSAGKAAALPVKSVAAPRGRRVELEGGTVLRADAVLLAVRIRKAGKLWSGATPLVWGLRPGPEWLIFREPVRLQKGARVDGSGAVTAVALP